MAENPQSRNRFKGELTIGDVADEAPVTRTGIDLTQFVQILATSWDKRESGSNSPAMGLTIPADARQLVDTRFRQAADELSSQRDTKIGVTINVVEAGTDRGNQYNLKAGQVRMIVEARPKKVMPSRGKKTDSNGAAPAQSAAKQAATPTKRTGGLPTPPAAKVKG